MNEQGQKDAMVDCGRAGDLIGYERDGSAIYRCSACGYTYNDGEPSLPRAGAHSIGCGCEDCSAAYERDRRDPRG